MNINIIVTGFIIGFSIAAPVGPIGVLCIRRTLAEGRTRGLATGLGAATADAVFGSIAGFGLTFVSDFLISQQLWFRLVGGLFICYLGLRTWLSKPATQAATVSGTGLVGAYTSTLFLTLTNPISILFFAGVFSTLGAAGVRFEAPAAVMLVLGIFLGSALWWLFLSVSVSLARSWFTPPLMQWVNRVSGVIIAGFGAVALLGVC